MKLTVNHIPLTFEATFTPAEVLRELEKSVLEKIGVGEDAFIKGDNWIGTFYTSHSFIEEIKSVTPKERELMNAISILRDYLEE